jgi:hypothetical protein
MKEPVSVKGMQGRAHRHSTFRAAARIEVDAASRNQLHHGQSSTSEGCAHETVNEGINVQSGIK